MKILNKLLFKYLPEIDFGFPAKTITAISIIFLSVTLSNSQSPDAVRQEILKSEDQAKLLSRQWNGDSIERSIALFSQTAKQREKLQNFSKAANNFREAAQLEFLLGNTSNAVTYLKESLRIENLHNLSAGKAITLSLLSTVLIKEGKIDESENYLNQARALVESTGDIKAQASFTSALAMLYEIQRKPEKALENYQKSSELWKQTGDSQRLAYSYTDSGIIYMSIGKPLSGIETIRKAETLFQQIEDARGLAISRIVEGHLYNAMDEKQLALDSYKKAEKTFPDNMDLLEKARLYNGIGLIYEAYEEWNFSIDYRLKALRLFRLANYPYGQLATLPSLLNLSILKNDSLSAYNYFSETQTLSARLKDTYFLAIAYRLMGDFYLKNSSFTKSKDYYFKALKTLKKPDLKLEIAIIEDKLGIVYENLGEFQTARNYYESSLHTSRTILNKFLEANTTYNLARLNSLENKTDLSLELMGNSIEITEKLSTDFLNSKLTRNYLSNVFDRYELYINILMKMHRQTGNEKYAMLALQTAEKSRARSILENLSLSEAEFTKDADSEIIKRENEIRVLLNTKADKLTDLLSQNAEKSETDKISNEINELENELEEIKASLKQNSPVYSAIKNPAPFDAGEFQKTILDDDSLLLEFSFGKEESYLWLIGKTEIGYYILPPREQIESKIQTLRELLAAREKLKDESIEDYQTRVKKAEEDYSLIAKELSRDLFGQVAGKFGNKRLIVVPDGKLGYFPVSALPLPDSEKNEPILLSNEVVYEPSASTLSIISANNKQKNSASKSLLIFSDPVFSAEDSRLSPENKTDLTANNETGEKFRFVESLNSLVRLDASKTEADSIVDILGASNADNFSGFAANRERLLNTDTAGYKILHFATHGLIDESRPELSGIVLSRFDENGNQQDEFFRLHDIYGMNLNSDLVVLSACNTGTGKEVRGEGLMSLNNAFLSVGAKSVMSSLWKVEDGATLELMKNVYDAMANENLTPSKALQKAQIKMLNGKLYKSPFYWAAFTVQGDYKNVPDVSSGFGVWIYFLSCGIVLSLAAFAGYRFTRRQNHK